MAALEQEVRVANLRCHDLPRESGTESRATSMEQRAPTRPRRIRYVKQTLAYGPSLQILAELLEAGTFDE
jgi:hypothetical protein